MMKRILIIWVLAGLFALPQLSFASYKSRYYEGYELYKKKKYISAIKHFQKMLDDSKTSNLSDNCQYWIGMSYFNLGKYKQALIEFDRTLIFQGTNKREDAIYMMALTYEKLDEPEQARQIYVRFMAEFPTSKRMSKVIAKVEELGIP